MAMIRRGMSTIDAERSLHSNALAQPPYCRILRAHWPTATEPMRVTPPTAKPASYWTADS